MPWFNVKIHSYQYRKSHSGDEMVMRSSYFHYGNSYNGKEASLCWMIMGKISILKCSWELYFENGGHFSLSELRELSTTYSLSLWQGYIAVNYMNIKWIPLTNCILRPGYLAYYQWKHPVILGHDVLVYLGLSNCLPVTDNIFKCLVMKKVVLRISVISFSSID